MRHTGGRLEAGRVGRIVLWGVTLLLAAAWHCPAGAEAFVPTEADRCPFTGRFPAEVSVPSARHLGWLESFGVDVDRVQGTTATVYVDDEELAELTSAGFEVEPIPNQARRAFLEFKEGVDSGLRTPGREDYHTYEALTAELQQMAADNPDIVMVTSIGQSEEGRELWVVKLSDNVSVDEQEPAFKYTSTMHGDEPVGTEMIVYLLRLLIDQYGVDPDLTALIDDLEIWFCPMHNPDGNANGTRYNASGYDLNRNFPDPADDPVDDPAGRPTEVQHMMIWQYDLNFTIGVNYHTGALVVNYPWDCWYGQYTPDHDQIHNLALGYSFRNPPMWNSTQFENGVVIGWEWYVVHGGFQDWGYHWRNELHYCIELNNVKWPSSAQLAGLWDDNRDSMIWLLDQARNGVEGRITDALDGSPVASTIDVSQIGKTIYNDAGDGFYHRMLEPGTYTLEVESYGYQASLSSPITVSAGVTTQHDVELQRDGDWYVVDGAVTEAGTGTPLSDAVVRAYLQMGGGVFSVEVAVNPGTGVYEMTLPGGTYDIVASAGGHLTVTETRTVNANLDLDFALPVSRADVLVVWDENPSAIIADDLTDLGYLATQETIVTTQPDTWANYDLLIWSAGSFKSPVRMAGRRDAIQNHVENGGKLLIEGGEIAYDALQSPGYGHFASDVLHISTYHGDNTGDLNLRAEQASHPLATVPNALPQTLDIDYDYFGDQDAASPTADAIVVYGPSSYPDDAGILVFESAERSVPAVVFYSFDYEALANDTIASELLENTVEYLLGDNQGIPENRPPFALRLSRPLPSVTSGPTVLHLSLPAGGQTRVDLFDASGRRVRTLAQQDYPAGVHTVSWDGRDGLGHAAAAGVYFVRAQNGDAQMTRRVVVVD